MNNLLLWGCGKDFSENIKSILHMAERYNLNIVGVYAKIFTNAITEEQCPLVYDIKLVNFDYVVIMTEKYYEEIFVDLRKIGISATRICSYIWLKRLSWEWDKYICQVQDLLLYPEYKESEKYSEFYKNVSIDYNTTILPLNCSGGLMYHKFSCEFKSPFINMFFKERHFIRFLSDYKNYLKEELRFVRYDFENDWYPVFALGDVELHMNHYKDASEARETFMRRKIRINLDKICVLGGTENPGTLELFDRLPFERKLCVVPFQSELKSAFCVNRIFVKRSKLGDGISDVLNSCIRNDIPQMDPFYHEKMMYVLEQRGFFKN